jgi:cytochrome c peroxidase
MAMPSEAHVVGLLKSMPEYEKLFSEAFPGEEHPVTYHNMAIAIGAFERRLVTPSRWDAYLKGDKTALTPEELKGFEVFTDTGCQACHMGPLVGGAMYQKLGLVKPWPNQTDTGKMEVTKQEADRMMFKVPSLRNVEHTAPYFHDGSVDSLDTAVALMAEHQLGRTLDSQQISAIVTWLKTLSANPAADYVKEPELPARTPSTPLADPS